MNPVWWDKTLTIYNKYTNPLTQVITWHRTVINDCFWKNTSDKVLVGTVTLETNNIIARIPKQNNFKPRFEWEKIPNDKMSDYFTLSSGDIIVLGDIEDEIDEYTQGKRLNDFLNKYKKLGVMTVQEFADNTGVSRNNEHYYVKGV